MKIRYARREKKTGDPAEAADLRSSENIKLDRVRLRDDALTAARARPGKPDGRAPPATRCGASRCNPQGTGTPEPGSRSQPTGAAAPTPGGKKRSAPRPTRLRKQAPQEQTIPRPPERGRETSNAAREAGEGQEHADTKDPRRDGCNGRRPSHRHRTAHGARLPGSSSRTGATTHGPPEPHGPPDSGRRPGPAGQGELGRTRRGDSSQPHGQPERRAELCRPGRGDHLLGPGHPTRTRTTPTP